MRKILFLLLLSTTFVKAQQTGVQPGTTAGGGQLIAKLVGSGTSATLSFGFGNNSFFNVPTTKAFMDSLTNIRNSGYLKTETDPTVPAYAKSLTAFSIIKNSTDLLYPTQIGGNASGTWAINISGTAANAAILQTPRTINGVSFNGSQNISFNSDAVIQGSTNLYFSNALARASVSGSGSINYNAATGVFSYSAPTLNNLTNGYGLTSLNYNTSSAAIVSVDNTVIAPLASPHFIGIPTIQPSNFAGMSTTNFPNSASGMIVYNGRNLSNVRDEFDMVFSPGISTGTRGGFDGWINNANGGTAGGLVNLFSFDGVSGTFTLPGLFVLGSMSTATTQANKVSYNTSTKQLELAAAGITPYRFFSGTTTYIAADFVILADATSGMQIYNLPDATTVPGLVLSFKNISGSSSGSFLRVSTFSFSQTIDGSTINDLPSRATLKIIAYNGNWAVIQ